MHMENSHFVSVQIDPANEGGGGNLSVKESGCPVE